MSDPSLSVGYNRTVRLRWLDFAAELMAAGQSKADIIAALQEYLSNELSIGSSALRGSREKSITIILKTWVRVQPALYETRDRAIALLRRCKRSDRLALHWGMTMTAYPFFGAVAEIVGRLLSLQKEFAAAQVHRRIREFYGERETVSRSTRYVLRAFVDWGVLKDASDTGVYIKGMTVDVSDNDITGFLISVISRFKGNRPSARIPIRSPALFPFRLQYPQALRATSISTVK